MAKKNHHKQSKNINKILGKYWHIRRNKSNNQVCQWTKESTV